MYIVSQSAFLSLQILECFSSLFNMPGVYLGMLKAKKSD